MSLRIHLPDEAAPFALVVALVVIAGYFTWYFPRSRTLLEHWAARSGVQIIHAQRRWLFQGPYFWTGSRWQPVFRVKVRDHHGHERSGWVLCGGFLSGVFSDQATVTWDDRAL
jgi:hypothetical protein